MSDYTGNNRGLNRFSDASFYKGKQGLPDWYNANKVDVKGYYKPIPRDDIHSRNKAIHEIENPQFVKIQNRYKESDQIHSQGASFGNLANFGPGYESDRLSEPLQAKWSAKPLTYRGHDWDKTMEEKYHIELTTQFNETMVPRAMDNGNVLNPTNYSSPSVIRTKSDKMKTDRVNTGYNNVNVNHAERLSLQSPVYLKDKCFVPNKFIPELTGQSFSGGYSKFSRESKIAKEHFVNIGGKQKIADMSKLNYQDQDLGENSRFRNHNHEAINDHKVVEPSYGNKNNPNKGFDVYRCKNIGVKETLNSKPKYSVTKSELLKGNMSSNTVDPTILGNKNISPVNNRINMRKMVSKVV